jgi:hypothetical protein
MFSNARHSDPILALKALIRGPGVQSRLIYECHWIPDHHAHGVMNGMPTSPSLRARTRSPVAPPVTPGKDPESSRVYFTSTTGFRIMTLSYPESSTESDQSLNAEGRRGNHEKPAQVTRLKPGFKVFSASSAALRETALFAFVANVFSPA